MKLWGHGFVSKSAAGTDLIPTLQRVAGMTAKEMTIQCPNCKVDQMVHVAMSNGLPSEERQHISCLNCASEFEVSVAEKIVGGPFIA